MFESGMWEEKENNEHTFPTIRSQVLSHVLSYLYTGDLVYPHDDLTMGVELLCCAQQFLIERLQEKMEDILARKIDNEVVLELYQAALSYGANYLFNKCCYHLLMNYSAITDPNHACLLHLFSLKKTGSYDSCVN
ncbi:Armadillo/beta-catenin repeat family protein [Oopsacas minuta]|uniref:Armadillo/beta-catenin repeat family protein n=1 Tax=Oopsacas minuta TaxID=111878 RepID=A0AAV7K143_9METZ|nr:Armadillo/beta-catenin repeat family protein [Oopsacas minuta]